MFYVDWMSRTLEKYAYATVLQHAEITGIEINKEKEKQIRELARQGGKKMVEVLASHVAKKLSPGQDRVQLVDGYPQALLLLSGGGGGN